MYYTKIIPKIKLNLEKSPWDVAYCVLMREWVNGITVCLVNYRAIDVFTQQVVIAVVFGNYVVAGI